MKKFIFSLLLVGLMIIPAFSITLEKLEQAEEILTQMDAKISVLRGYVSMARQGVVQDINLTTEQKDELKNKYLAEKAELVSLYQQLP